MEKLKVLIGRSSQCDYIVENKEQYMSVSSKHATISETDMPNCYMFEDHSTNGSYINGQYVHNGSCTISPTDHITLGKAYVLPIDDINKRYFSSTRTTAKKVVTPQPQAEPVNQPQPIIEDRGSIPSQETNSQPINTPVHEPVVIKEVNTVEKVPAWFWILYVASVIIAFGLGYIIFGTY